MLRGKFISVNVYVKKKKDLISIISPSKPKSSIRKEIVKTGASVNEVEGLPWWRSG